MTADPDTNPRWLSAAFTAVPILLSILYAVVAGRSPRPNKPADSPFPAAAVAAR